jgi:ELWxxDGT repeat protein
MDVSRAAAALHARRPEFRSRQGPQQRERVGILRQVPDGRHQAVLRRLNGLDALCRSDGTAQGTAVLTTGKEGTFRSPIVASQGQVFSHLALVDFGGTIRRRIRVYAYLYSTNPATGACTHLKTLNNEIPWKASVNGAMLFQVLTWVSNFAGTDLAFSLWKSNGTAAGTVAVTDINPGSGNSCPTMAARMSCYLYFCATDGITGYQVWRYPLAGGAAQRVTNIDGGTLGAHVYFPAEDGSGFALWRSDGVTTERLGAVSPRCLTAVNGKLLFVGYGAAEGYELWKFDPSLPIPPKLPAATPSPGTPLPCPRACTGAGSRRRGRC